MHAREAALHRSARTQPTYTAASLAVLTVVIGFLLTRWSTFVWHHAPELAFLQFPWRFLSIESAVAVLLLFLLANSFRALANLRSAGAHALLLLATFAIIGTAAWTAGGEYQQACDDEDPPAAQHAVYLSGNGETPPTDEYTPTTADNDALHRLLPTAWIATSDDASPDPAAAGTALAVSDGNPGHLHFIVPASAVQQVFVVRLRRFRGWALTLDGSPVQAGPERNDGLVDVVLPAGAAHEVDLRYRWTWDETTGLLASIAALLTALLVRYPLRLRRPRVSA